MKIKELKTGDVFRFNTDGEKTERVVESKGLYEYTIRTIKGEGKGEVIAVNRFSKTLTVIKLEKECRKNKTTEATNKNINKTKQTTKEEKCILTK